MRYFTRSGEKIGQTRFERALRLHDELARFTHCAAAGFRVGHVVHALAYDGGRVGHRQSEPAARQDRQIHPIVSHVGAGRRLQRELCGERAKGAQFLIDALKKQVDSKVLCTPRDASGLPTGDDRKRNAARLQHFHAVPVSYVKHLRFFTAVAIVQATVREDAVDIEDRESYRSRLEVHVLHGESEPARMNER
jgi:hypothetical protein